MSSSLRTTTRHVKRTMYQLKMILENPSRETDQFKDVKIERNKTTRNPRLATASARLARKVSTIVDRADIDPATTMPNSTMTALENTRRIESHGRPGG